MPNPVHVDIPEGIDEFAWFEDKDENDDSDNDEDLVKFEVFHLLEKNILHNAAKDMITGFPSPLKSHQTKPDIEDYVAFDIKDGDDEGKEERRLYKEILDLLYQQTLRE